MNRLCCGVRTVAVLVSVASAAAALGVLSGCGPQAASSSGSSAAADGASAASSPFAGIKPQPLDTPATSAGGPTGPADASTAVGGMTGGAKTGGGGGSTGGAAPAPTSGDGAASSAKAPSAAASG